MVVIWKKSQGELFQMQQDKSLVYCLNKMCKCTSCMRHDVHAPYNVVIKMSKFPVNSDGSCKYRLEMQHEKKEDLC